MKRASFLLAIVVLACFSGCASATTRVTRFHQLPPRGDGRTFVIAPLENRSQIEMAGYTARIAAYLEKYGWRQVQRADADCLIGYGFGVTDGKRGDSSVPIFGQTGGGATYHSGSFNSYGPSGTNYGTVSGTSYTPPTFGVVGSIPVSRTLYTRWLIIMAKDKKSKELFEMRCTSTGTVSEISEVLPVMIDSAFADFPGVSGKTKSYERAF